MTSKNIYKIITEQFNISNMDFNNNKKQNKNIFNKNKFIDPGDIYDDIINNSLIDEGKILYLNDYISVVKLKNIQDLYKIVEFYAMLYWDESMNWLDVSGVTDMTDLFRSYNYTGDISRWDVSHVTNMHAMFAHSTFNGDISEWDVSNVTDMSNMFYDAAFNRDISGWDVSNVITMQNMFEFSRFNGDISQWNINNVVNMNEMFYKSKFNRDISRWDISNVLYKSQMFSKGQIRDDYKPKI